ncbi:hypothetical protein OIDMADRAFT_155064 [Oidiodendron maius Zn]|uniref:SUN domain-containing protein n=1 Tax=Oidiodendron maius (strain Zn) TaxID=913774 RepID=A0A0C3DVS6_OIDMZ|nr:hypothetical protein OIDMADRAFT_155064 [Oidiodendron maius Zn]
MKDGATATSSGIANHELIANKVGNGTHKNENSPRSDPSLVTPISVPSTTETNLSPSFEADGGELNEAAFLSFEEWKKQTLEKAGQVNENIGNKKPFEPGQKRRDPESVQSSFDSLVYRREDAGKTYKERFSYASFDGGATVLKTHPGAKNAKAVLVENKDSYMLSECAAENKFLIIELSEDIWIDTLVLANYEFFSSMIRTFRVSVSDRYPVKLEKWKDLGTYEARNSREIQAFLIENPQIWARYIRIEFLSHYGNEYYCPLSLVRVHGTRMLESWKETEAIGDEDESEDSDEQGTEEHFVPDAVALTPDTTVSSQETNSTATATASFTGRSQNVTSPQKNKTATSTSSAASSLPTIQESFFNAVSRRLQLLEANSTLSLKYIEEQSKILREAFTKVEKKQLQKTETFLDTLNSTVLEELRGFRQQYDEIWQSTVISLESQREESKREILAVSTRLNILADEVIFQKRMSIVQSVLLLLCLGLIIFSRVSAGGALEFPSMQVRTRNSVFHATPGDSPVESPSLRCRDDSPPTPISSYSRSDNALTPPSGGDDCPTSNPVFRASDYVDPSTQSTHSATTSPQSTVWRGHSDNDESTYLSPSSAGTPRRRDGLVNQQLYQPTSRIHQDVIGGSQTSLEYRSWVGQDGRSEDKSLHLPSPPPERRSEETEQYIACKPLPALPQQDS